MIRKCRREMVVLMLLTLLVFWAPLETLAVYCSVCVYCDTLENMATCGIPGTCGVCPTAVKQNCLCLAFFCGVHCSYTRCNDGAFIATTINLNCSCYCGWC